MATRKKTVKRPSTAKKTAQKKTTAKKTSTSAKSTAAKKGASAASTKVAETSVPAAEATTKTASPKKKPLSVLIVAAESAPLAKTGGLADVVGALPKYLNAEGADARVIMPFHSAIKAKYRNETRHLFDYNLGPQFNSRFVGIDELEIDGVTYYFVDNEYFFGGPIYTGGNFEGEQYAFFVQAVCDCIPNLGFDPDVIHCNDWHTAMIPFKLKAKAAREGHAPTATLLTIHNLAFQGTFGEDINAMMVGGDERAYAWDLGAWNMMKAGIDTADRVNTVSPSYANEICTPEYGEGLQADLAHLRDEGRLCGILNGIDESTWDPKTDKNLVANFDASAMSGKAACKKALLADLGMDVDMDAPLIAMVGRLTPQKGIGLAIDAIEACVPKGAMFVVLGSGYPDLEWQLRQAEERHKGRVCSYIGYNDELSHRIYAAADFFLMPSAFEPCGISQMIAMRYGTLPIVHETGGLKDTVIPYNEFTGEGCGFSFARFDGADAVAAMDRALTAYGDKKTMDQLIGNAMKEDFGFARCAQSYADLYRSMI